jgi:OmpA-OmpF porin, OOP family
VNKKGSWGIFAAVLLLGLAAAPAAAQEDKGLYLGGSLGEAKSKNTCEGFPGPCDDTDTAYKLFGGYQVNRYFAWELGYGYLGDVTGTSVFGSFEVTNKALDFSAIIALPINERFAVYGRLGVYRSQVELRGAFAGLQGGDHNTSFTWGLGLRFDFGRAVAVRAEWQHYPEIGGSNAGIDDIDYLSLGLVMRF